MKKIDDTDLRMYTPNERATSNVCVPLRRGKTEFVSVADLWHSRIEALFLPPASNIHSPLIASLVLPSPTKAALAVWAQYAPFRPRPMVVRYFDWFRERYDLVRYGA